MVALQRQKISGEFRGEFGRYFDKLGAEPAVTHVFEHRAAVHGCLVARRLDDVSTLIREVLAKSTNKHRESSTAASKLGRD